MNQKKSRDPGKEFDKQFEDLAKKGQAKKYKLKRGVAYSTDSNSYANWFRTMAFWSNPG